MPIRRMGTESAATRNYAIERAIALLFGNGEESEIARVRFADGKSRVVRAKELVSGRLNKTDRRSKSQPNGLHPRLKFGDPGIRREDVEPECGAFAKMRAVSPATASMPFWRISTGCSHSRSRAHRAKVPDRHRYHVHFLTPPPAMTPTPIENRSCCPRSWAATTNSPISSKARRSPPTKRRTPSLPKSMGCPPSGAQAIQWPVTAKTNQPRSTVESLVITAGNTSRTALCLHRFHPRRTGLPESRSAADSSMPRAMLEVDVAAMKAANQRRDPEDGKIVCSQETAPRCNAWGTHSRLSHQPGRFTNVMDRPPLQAFLASVHAAGVLFGQAKSAPRTTGRSPFSSASGRLFFQGRHA